MEWMERWPRKMNVTNAIGLGVVLFSWNRHHSRERSLIFDRTNLAPQNRIDIRLSIQYNFQHK